MNENSGDTCEALNENNFDTCEALKTLNENSGDTCEALNENNFDRCEAMKTLNENSEDTYEALNENNFDTCEALKTRNKNSEDTCDILNENNVDTRLVKQRSDKWHKLRDDVLVTGSTLYAATGCDGLKRHKDHFEKVICGVAQTEYTEFTKTAMQHGTDNETNGVATVVGKVVPVVAPHLTFCEEGCIVVKNEQGREFFVISPNVSLRKDFKLTLTNVAIEIKCPLRSVHTTFFQNVICCSVWRIYLL